MLLAGRRAIEKIFYTKLFALRFYHLFLRARYTDWESKTIAGNKKPKPNNQQKSPNRIVCPGCKSDDRLP